jgi:hypothetical protein
LSNLLEFGEVLYVSNTIPSVGNLLSMATSQLHELFSKSVGLSVLSQCSPVDYLLSLLCDTDKVLDDVLMIVQGLLSSQSKVSNEIFTNFPENQLVDLLSEWVNLFLLLFEKVVNVNKEYAVFIKRFSQEMRDERTFIFRMIRVINTWFFSFIYLFF